MIGHSTNTHGGAVYWILVIALLITDQVTKTIAVVLLEPGAPVDIAGGALRLVLIFNEQGPGGFPADRHARAVVVFLTAIALLLVVWASTRRARWLSHTGAAALGAITGGLAGNLVDRLWSSRGVVDFLDVGVGTVNVADLGIGVGVCLLLTEMG